MSTATRAVGIGRVVPRFTDRRPTDCGSTEKASGEYNAARQASCYDRSRAAACGLTVKTAIDIGDGRYCVRYSTMVRPRSGVPE